MITDIHEIIKEKMREAINQPNSDNIIADFISYNLPYRIEQDAEGANNYTGDNPWSKIAKKIKENPDILKSQDMAYTISASFRPSTKIYATNEFNFAFSIMEKLKVLKDDGIITEAQFQEILNLKSPETGETLLTQTMKDALNLARGNGTMQMFNRLLEVGVDVNVPNARGQYPIEIIKHYQNIRKKNIEYSIDKGLVSRDFISEDYTFPREKEFIEDNTTSETIEKIKQKEKKSLMYKKTQKIRAYITESTKDVSNWKENGPQGYAYAINAVEPTYLTEDSWAIDTIILPGKYVVYEGRGEEQQVISVEKFYSNHLSLYLIENKRLRAIDSREVLKTLAGGNSDKALAMPSSTKKTINNNKNVDMNNVKTGLKQLEGASDQLFKKITRLLKK